MYLLKNFIGAFANPLLTACLIGLVGWLCSLGGRRKWALGCAVSALSVGYFGSTSAIGDALLWPLERQYPPLADQRSLPNVSDIVVLGSAYDPHDGIPVTAALDAEGLVRLVEGVRIARRLPRARLIVSGGAQNPSARPAVGYARLARELGIEEASIVIAADPLDTAGEARSVIKLLGATPFILITTADHMPRAMQLMLRLGAMPIPAPTGQKVSGHAFAPANWLPSSGGVDKTEQALHEYLGLAAIGLGLA